MIYTMNFTMNFTMSYNIAPFSHTFNVQSIWFGKRSESLRASDKPNLISTNERGDNIRPMRRGDYFTIFGSCLRPAVFLGSFAFPFLHSSQILYNFAHSEHILHSLHILHNFAHFCTFVQGGGTQGTQAVSLTAFSEFFFTPSLRCFKKKLFSKTNWRKPPIISLEVREAIL